MRVTVVAVGRLRNDALAAAIDDYRRRIGWPVTVSEVTSRKELPLRARLAEEARKLEVAIPAGAVVVVLDERGSDLDSRSLAAQIRAWRDQGETDLAFVIGGADGLEPALRARARLVLAFGRQTWPHRLVRLMLVEQLYRAWTLTAGHPYHRD